MKNIIITGGANGVGKAIANILKDNKLILVDIDKDNLIKASQELNGDYYVCDLADDNQIKELFNYINEKYENIDCLINCAGMWISGDISKLDKPVFDEMNDISRIKQVINTNIYGTIAMIKCVFPIMKKQGYGQITVESEDIQVPYAYALYDSYGQIVKSVDGLTTASNNKVSEPEFTIGMDEFELTNQKYKLVVTDDNGKTLKRNVEMEMPLSASFCLSLRP